MRPSQCCLAATISRFVLYPDSKTSRRIMKQKQVKPARSEPVDLDTRKVRDIIEPLRSISSKSSVKAALEEMQACATKSSPVTDERGELLGTLSQDKTNRDVGGRGHDPQTEPLDAHLDKNSACCLADQTVAEAEEIMLRAKVSDISVITAEKLLLGTVSLKAIARGKTKQPPGNSEMASASTR